MARARVEGVAFSQTPAKLLWVRGLGWSEDCSMEDPVDSVVEQHARQLPVNCGRVPPAAIRVEG